MRCSIDATGVFHHAGSDARVEGPAPDRKSYASFFSFSDPDGNGWYVQEITVRPSGALRVWVDHPPGHRGPADQYRGGPH